MRKQLVLLAMLLCWAIKAPAEVNIDINLSVFPELAPVPGYPVYYAPRVDSNYFFYDGMYWVYADDDWYASSWYNGPWERVAPDFVPLFILRVPVRYYRHAPVYFRGWRRDAPPRWDRHWGHDWAQHRRGWDRWDRTSTPPRPPLPVYQRQYSGARYPDGPQQLLLQDKNYRYQPHDPLVRQRHEVERQQASPAQRGPQASPQERSRVPRPDDRPAPQIPGPPKRPLPQAGHEPDRRRDQVSGPESRVERRPDFKPAAPVAPIAPGEPSPRRDRPPAQHQEQPRPQENRHPDQRPTVQPAAPVVPREQAPPRARPAFQQPEAPQRGEIRRAPEAHDRPAEQQGKPAQEQRPDSEHGKGNPHTDDRRQERGK